MTIDFTQIPNITKDIDGRWVAIPNTEKLNNNQCPYDVPTFLRPPQKNIRWRYHWYSWHPRYPYWSKSYLKSESINEAMELLKKPEMNKFEYCHNKLIKEGDGNFIEVMDIPCKYIESWNNVAKCFVDSQSKKKEIKI